MKPAVKRALSCLAIPTLLASLTLVAACRADTTGLATLTIVEAAALLAASPAITPVDANTEKTRARYGVLPGALLLPVKKDADVSETLPANLTTQLVFYCHSASCGSAANAARAALEAGYSQVSVMPDGITGWVDADQPVAQSAKS